MIIKRKIFMVAENFVYLKNIIITPTETAK